jgi:hypothetical protein
MVALGTFTFQIPGELEKESEAKNGITKLMLLHICADIDYKGLSVSNILFAYPLQWYGSSSQSTTCCLLHFSSQPDLPNPTDDQQARPPQHLI